MIEKSDDLLLAISKLTLTGMRTEADRVRAHIYYLRNSWWQPRARRRAADDYETALRDLDRRIRIIDELIEKYRMASR